MKNKLLFLFVLLTLLFSACKTTYHKSETLILEQQAVNAEIPMDSSIVKIYSPYKTELEKQMTETIGTVSQPFVRNRSKPETLASNFFANTMLAIGKTIDPTTQIAMGTKDGIRSDIRDGAVTVGHIFEFMPFENYFVILDLTGQDFFKLCQFIAKTGGQPIAGFRMKIYNGEPQDIEINGIKFDISKNYKLITYDYLANGGDYITGLSNPVKRYDSNIRIREGIIDFIRQQTKLNKTINAELDGRVSIIK